MGDEIKLQINVEEGSSIRTVDEFNRALEKSGSAALRADSAFQLFISDMSASELTTAARNLGLIEIKVNGVKDAMERAADSARQFREEQAKAARPDGGAGLNDGAFQGPLQSSAALLSPFAVVSDRAKVQESKDKSLLENFNEAAKGLGDIEDKAKEAAKGFTGMGESGQQSSQLVNESIDALKGQLSDLAGGGGIIGDLFDVSKAIGPAGIAIASIGTVAIGLVDRITSDIRKKAEEHLKEIEKLFSIKTIGLTGGLSTVESELKDLQDAQTEISQLRQIGDSAGANKILEDKIGAGGNQIIFEARLAQAEERFRKLQQAAFQRGDDSLFSQAVSDLANARGEATVGDRATAFRLFQQFTDGKLSVEDFNDEIKKTGEEIKKAAESGRGLDEFLNKNLEQKRQTDTFRLSSINELKTAFSGIRGADSSNPFISLFDAAENRMESFEQRFSFLGDKLVSVFKDRNEQILKLEIFKAGLGVSQNAIGLLTEAEFTRRDRSFENANLNRGLLSLDLEAQARALRGREDVDPAELARRQFLEILGSSASRQALNDSILKITGGLSSDDLDRSGLRQARIEALFTGSDLARGEKVLERERAQRQIEALDRIALKDFTGADLRQAEGSILDRVLAVTNGLGENLDPALRERRAVALERRAQLDANLLQDAIQQKAEDRELNKRLALAIEKWIAVSGESAIVTIQDKTTPGTVAIERAIGGAPALSAGPSGPTASSPVQTGGSLSNNR